MSEIDLQRQIAELQRRLDRLTATDSAKYTEGTWSPSFAGSTTAGTYNYTASAQARYTRIGNLCFIQGRCAISAINIAPVGVMRITGLPFSAVNTTNLLGSIYFGDIYNFNYAAAAMQLQGYIIYNQSYIQLEESFDNAASADCPAANFTNGNCDLSFSGFYTI